jgi:hypothetical protein
MAFLSIPLAKPHRCRTTVAQASLHPDEEEIADLHLAARFDQMLRTDSYRSFSKILDPTQISILLDTPILS